jgi:hypothetical protein
LRLRIRRRFPPPWSVEELNACFAVRDHSGQKLAYVYFEDPRAAAKDRRERGETARAIKPRGECDKTPREGGNGHGSCRVLATKWTGNKANAGLTRGPGFKSSRTCLAGATRG